MESEINFIPIPFDRFNLGDFLKKKSSLMDSFIQMELRDIKIKNRDIERSENRGFEESEMGLKQSHDISYKI